MTRTLLLALLLAGPAVAQTDADTIDKLADQYGDFAPAEEDAPAQEPAPEAEPEPEAEAEAEAAAEAPQPAAAAAARQTVADPGPAEIPDGWARHEAFGLTFAVPADWKVIRERDDVYAVATPDTDPKKKQGLGLGIQLVDADDFDKYFRANDEFVALLEADERPPLAIAPGIGFDRFSGVPQDSRTGLGAEGVISFHRHAEHGHHLINFLAWDPDRIRESGPLIERIFATMRLADPDAFKAQTTPVGQDGAAQASGPVTTLGGLVTIRPPEGWELEPGEEEATLRTKAIRSATITLRRGAAARDALAFEDRLQGPPTESAGQILGQPARIHSGQADYIGMQSGARLERGEHRLYVLENCLPGGVPVTVETAAAPGWLAENDFTAALAAITADWPEGMAPCPEAITQRARFALDGRFGYRLPEGFDAFDQRFGHVIRHQGPYAALRVWSGPPHYDEYAAFPNAFVVAQPEGAASRTARDGKFAAPPRVSKGTIMGEPATLFTGRKVAGDATHARQLSLLDRCMPDGNPVLVDLSAEDAWMAARDGFTPLTENAWLLLPGDAAPCDPALLETAMEMSRATPPGEPATPSEPAPAAETAQERQSIAPPLPRLGATTPAAQGDTPEGWARHAGADLSVAVPADWTAREGSDGIVLTSPTDDLDIFVYAMPPDWGERFLTNADLRAEATASDIRPVQLAPDVTFLAFALEPGLSDPPRHTRWLLSQYALPGDGFPVVIAEAPSAESLAAQEPLIDQIMGTVRLVDAAGFTARATLAGPGWAAAETAPSQPPAAPTPPAPKLAAAGPDGDMSGWIATAARYTAGPDQIDAEPGSDDGTSYFIAPDTALGDWSGATALTFDKKSSGGRYYADGYGYDGDIVIEGPAGQARYRLPKDHTGQWRSFRIPLDGAGWTLSDGTPDLAAVLRQVTGLRIRAEYGVGTDRAALRDVRLLRGAPAARPEPSVRPEQGAWQAVGEPVKGGLDSKLAVRNGPTAPTVFRLASRGMIDRITTYHWNNGRGAVPGTIGLRAEDGRVYGPWPAHGSAGQGGVSNAYWHVTPGVVLPAGRYTVLDSDPATWATNDEVGNRGIFTIEVRKVRRVGAETGADTGAETARDAPAISRVEPERTAAPPSPRPSDYDTPPRGSAERAALMDAARIPVQRALGLPVIFLVSQLRSDGNWAYLAAEPLSPDGTKLDWSRTPFAREWANDMMSDLVLAVLHRDAGGWRVVEHVIGPTDVAWLNWVDAHGWPHALFTDRDM